MSHEVVRTRGGHLAIRCTTAGEVMHPGVGPLQEAAALYVAQSHLVARLEQAAPAPLTLFDVGLGAASNAVAARAAVKQARSPQARLRLVSFEQDLGALALALAHGADFGLTGEHADAARALLAAGVHHGAGVDWHLQRGELLATLERLPDEALRADVIFWDPFSPRANPTLWTVRAFAAARAVAGPRCTLFTYSASTATRVALLLAGWAVGVGDATGAKDETTAAAVSAADLARPLPAAWLARPARPDAPRPSDCPADVLDRLRALPQFAGNR